MITHLIAIEVALSLLRLNLLFSSFIDKSAIYRSDGSTPILAAIPLINASLKSSSAIKDSLVESSGIFASSSVTAVSEWSSVSLGDYSTLL